MNTAAGAPRAFYDARYRRGYQSELLVSGYDACVRAALLWALDLPDAARPSAILDFGCGQGRHLGELSRRFPDAELTGTDISGVGLELAERRFPAAGYLVTEGSHVPAESARFDLIVAIDVIEHVVDTRAVASEFARLLRPGGVLVITTPCANRLSLAWLFNLLTGGFEPTPDGVGRFATDEPAHLRRLRSGDATALLEAAGLEVLAIRWWAHLLTPIVDVGSALRWCPPRWRRALASLDWRLFRRAPNGAAMVVVARLPAAAA